MTFDDFILSVAHLARVREGLGRNDGEEKDEAENVCVLRICKWLNLV